MPRRFVSKHWDPSISNPVSLLLPDFSWKVTWKKHGSDVIMSGDQWKKFTKFYSLDVEHSLWFSFCRHNSRVQGTQFNVEIHESGLEIEYHVSEESTHDSGEESDKSTADENENENENEVHGSSRRQKKRVKSPLPFSGSSKKVKNNPKEGHHKSCHSLHAAGIESRRVTSEDNTNPKNNTDKRVISQAKGGWCEEEPLKDSRISRADKAVVSSENGIIRCTMRRSYIERKRMSMPGSFVPAHLHKEEGDVTLWVSRVSWVVRFKLNQTTKQFSLSTGWKKFAEENTLKIGDECVFKKINSEELSYSVEIERAKRASSPHLVQESEKRKQTGLQSNFAEGSGRGIVANVMDNGKRGISQAIGGRCSKSVAIECDEEPLKDSKIGSADKAVISSENDIIRCTMHRSYIERNTMSVPRSFVPADLHMDEGNATLWVSENSWLVRFKLNLRSNQFSLTTGWRKFAEENTLNKGDECVFKIMDSEELSYSVEIQRAKRASSPPLVQEAEKRKQTGLQSNFAEGSERGIAANVMDNDSEFPRNNSKRENQFIITLENTHMKETKIPLDFIKKHVTDKVTRVRLQAKGRRWPVDVSYDSEDDSPRFSFGWSAFVRECELKEGDQCVFELVDKENFVLEVKASRYMF